MKFLRTRWLALGLETYGGLVKHGAPGTHERLVELVLSQGGPKAGVLDLGAGSGELLQRLGDAGYTDLNAADLFDGNFKLSDVPFTRVDLNRKFSEKFRRKFTLVIMSSVIEHLDSPRHALKEVRALLDDGGLLTLSKPNVGFWEGRLKFLLTGDLWSFGESEYRGVRHISPLTSTQMRLMLHEIGFEVVAFTTAGSYATRLRKALFFPLWAPMAALFGRHVLGENLLVLARKAPPDALLSSAETSWAH
ncbi:methyltransferase family protein [Roseiarcus fermentans]|uniref:Methyltransferase family protein n=1 Tax=Roseiarcus fermentans TaxID=1473586 RepID=A0A366EEY2_9HYPH|nr:methyltransferase domain-containing protein [Roseiarcus fermentans]RBP00967.1 methyltransferase family protein [Roseiarcus fermentans]